MKKYINEATVKPGLSRRNFLQRISLGIGASAFAGAGMLQSCQKDDNGETPQPSRQIGIALVGLGEYSTEQLGPALRWKQIIADWQVL